MKVLEKGRTKERRCENCNCKFEYEEKDVVTTTDSFGSNNQFCLRLSDNEHYLNCPSCKLKIIVGKFQHLENVLKNSSDYIDGYIKALQDVNQDVKSERKIDLNYDLTAMLLLIKNKNKEVNWESYKYFCQISTERTFKIGKSQRGYHLCNFKKIDGLNMSSTTKTYENINKMQYDLGDKFIPIK